MGGYGSGWTGSRKTTVEECRKLDAGRMQKEKVFPEDGQRFGSWVWSNADTGEELSRIGYHVCTMPEMKKAPFLRLIYTLTASGEQLDYLVRLTKTPLPWGGVRWGFRCPCCGRSCRKLYFPPGDCKYYACRQCYRLTYKSTQDAHKLDRGFRVFMGMTPAEGRAWLWMLEQERKLEEKWAARRKRKMEKKQQQESMKA